jgi:hypothetical protein
MNAATQKLNVIFHGMFAFVLWRDAVEVLAPEEEDHVYKAGSWGRERRLDNGQEYTLEGVRPGPAAPDLDPTENLIVSGLTHIVRDPNVLFCSFNLPLPQSINGLRRVTLQPDRPLFGGTVAREVSPRRIPLVQVLTYQVEDWKHVRLEPLPVWAPSPSVAGIANLHIWAESDSFFTEAERDHPMHGFQQMMRLFPDLDLTLLYSTGAPMEQSVEVRGVEVWEQATLRERSRLVYGAGPRGAEVTNCLSIHVSNTTIAKPAGSSLQQATTSTS